MTDIAAETLVELHDRRQLEADISRRPFARPMAAENESSSPPNHRRVG
jgi:hypothetical protein